MSKFDGIFCCTDARRGVLASQVGTLDTQRLARLYFSLSGIGNAVLFYQ